MQRRRRWSYLQQQPDAIVGVISNDINLDAVVGVISNDINLNCVTFSTHEMRQIIEAVKCCANLYGMGMSFANVCSDLALTMGELPFMWQIMC
jgi:hypothetical protein